MDVLIKKALAKILFWIYDLIDTIGAIFNILVGTQKVEGGAKGRSLLEVLVESAISTKVLLSLVVISVIITGVCVGVKVVKNVFKMKAGGESASNAATVGQGAFAVLSSVVCIFFVVVLISFVAMLLNMVNGVMNQGNDMSLGQNLFSLSVEQTYVVTGYHKETTDEYFYDDLGNKVQDTDEDGNLLWEDAEHKNPQWKRIEVNVPDYAKNPDGTYVLETGWRNGHTASDLRWSMTTDEVFGVHKKDTLGIWEDKNKGYRKEPMVELESFNLFTAYLVAIIMVMSMFLLTVGLVKRMYDIVVLIICMPLVCGTIPLDDGARFRAWRETFMSKLLVAFGAVVAINVFYVIGGYITGPGFGSVITYLTEQRVLNNTSAVVFKMVMLLGGALCINGSQALVARVLGTSADESREAMQALGTMVSGVRMGAAGLAGAGRLAGMSTRAIFGGTNRYGRKTTGALNYLARIGNKVGEAAGGERYANSRGGRFVRRLGRMDPNYQYNPASRRRKNSEFVQPNSIDAPHAANSANGTSSNSSKAGELLNGSSVAPSQSSAQKKAGVYKKGGLK